MLVERPRVFIVCAALKSYSRPHFWPTWKISPVRFDYSTTSSEEAGITRPPPFRSEDVLRIIFHQRIYIVCTQKILSAVQLIPVNNVYLTGQLFEKVSLSANAAGAMNIYSCAKSKQHLQISQPPVLVRQHRKNMFAGKQRKRTIDTVQKILQRFRKRFACYTEKMLRVHASEMEPGKNQRPTSAILRYKSMSRYFWQRQILLQLMNIRRHSQQCLRKLATMYASSIQFYSTEKNW